jgi:hypothetical protein
MGGGFFTGRGRYCFPVEDMLPISLCKTRCSPRLSHLMVSPDQFVSTTVPRSAWSSCQQTLSPTFSCLDCWPVICSPVKLCPEWNFQIAGLSSVFRADQNMDGVRIGAYKPSAGLQPDPNPFFRERYDQLHRGRDEFWVLGRIDIY